MRRRFFQAKQPAEKYLVGIDFSEDLASGELISSPVVTAYDSDGVDVSATIIDDSPQVGTVSGKTFTLDASGTWVVITVKAGIAGNTYKITFVAPTDTPHIFEGDIMLSVIDT